MSKSVNLQRLICNRVSLPYVWSILLSRRIESHRQPYMLVSSRCLHPVWHMIFYYLLYFAGTNLSKPNIYCCIIFTLLHEFCGKGRDKYDVCADWLLICVCIGWIMLTWLRPEKFLKGCRNWWPWMTCLCWQWSTVRGEISGRCVRVYSIDNKRKSGSVFHHLFFCSTGMCLAPTRNYLPQKTYLIKNIICEKHH